MFDLYKGATRPPMLFGVPTEALLMAFVGVGTLSVAVGLVCWLLFPVVLIIMRLIAKRDDKAFRQYGLWIETKLRCKKEVKKFWGATTYTPLQAKNKWYSWDNKKELKK